MLIRNLLATVVALLALIMGVIHSASRAWLRDCEREVRSRAAVAGVRIATSVQLAPSCPINFKAHISLNVKNETYTYHSASSCTRALLHTALPHAAARYVMECDLALRMVRASARESGVIHLPLRGDKMSVRASAVPIVWAANGDGCRLRARQVDVE